MIHDDKEKSNQELINNFKGNPKAFYVFVKNKQSVKATVIQLRKSGKSLTQSEVETANELLTFFQSVFVHEDTRPIPTCNKKSKQQKW